MICVRVRVDHTEKAIALERLAFLPPRIPILTSRIDDERLAGFLVPDEVTEIVFMNEDAPSPIGPTRTGRSSCGLIAFDP
jgi:hypothetical protein